MSHVSQVNEIADFAAELKTQLGDVRGLLDSLGLLRDAINQSSALVPPGGRPTRARFGLVTAERETGLLTCATGPEAPAFAGLSVVGGPWTNGIAARVPDGSIMSVQTHLDAAVNKYADRVYRSLAPQGRLARRRNPA